MRRTKKTLRKMLPTQRELSKLANEALSLHRRLTNMAEKVGQLESDSFALESYMTSLEPPEEEVA